MKSKLLNNDYILSMISKAFNIVFGFFSLILLNRYLGTYIKGEYSTIINYVSIISSIFQLGISIIYSRFKRKNISNCYYIFTSLSILQFFIYLIISIGLGLVVGQKLLIILIISSIAILTTQLRYINLVENIKYNTLIVIIMSLTNFFSTLISFLFLQKSLLIGLVIYVVKDLIIIIMYFLKINYKYLFKKEYIKTYKKILIEGFLPMLSNLLIIINYKIDVVMLNSFKIDYSMIGIYSLGLSISEYMWIIPDIFKDVVQKRTAKDNSINTINFSLRCASTIIIVCYIILLIIGKKMFGIVFGKEFVDAYYITKILFIGVYCMLFYKIIGQLFISDNKSKQYFLILLVGAIINVIFNYILIPKLNIVGASIASIVSYSLIGIVFLGMYLVQYKTRIKDVLFIKKSDIKKFKKLFINNSILKDLEGVKKNEQN